MDDDRSLSRSHLSIISSSSDKNVCEVLFPLPIYAYLWLCESETRLWGLWKFPTVSFCHSVYFSPVGEHARYGIQPLYSSHASCMQIFILFQGENIIFIYLFVSKLPLSESMVKGQAMIKRKAMLGEFNRLQTTGRSESNWKKVCIGGFKFSLTFSAWANVINVADASNVSANFQMQWKMNPQAHLQPIERTKQTFFNCKWILSLERVWIWRWRCWSHWDNMTFDVLFNCSRWQTKARWQIVK